MDMRIPFKIPAESMQDHDKTRVKFLCLFILENKQKDNTGDGMKETVKERAILQEKITEGRINGKNAMTVSDINELKGHRGSAIHGIFYYRR